MLRVTRVLGVISSVMKRWSMHKGAAPTDQGRRAYGQLGMLLALCVSLALSACGIAADNRANELERQAFAAERQGDFRRAGQFFEQAGGAYSRASQENAVLAYEWAAEAYQRAGDARSAARARELMADKQAEIAGDVAMGNAMVSSMARSMTAGGGMRSTPGGSSLQAPPSPSARGACNPGPRCAAAGRNAESYARSAETRFGRGASAAGMGAYCVSMVGAEISRVCADEMAAMGMRQCADQARAQQHEMLRAAQQSQAASAAAAAGPWQQNCGWR